VNTEATLISAVCKNKDISTLLADNVDDLFISHRDIWESLKSYYYKFKAVPEVGVLMERHKDFEPVNAKAETGYYLDQLKNEYLSSKLKGIILQSGSALKEDAASRVLADMQSKLASLSKFTNNVRDIDVTDLDSAEKHLIAVKERSAAMGGSPGILTGFEAIDKAYPTGMAPGHLIVAIGWPGRGNKKFENKNGFILVSNEGMGEVNANTVQAKIDQHKPDLVILDYHQLFSDIKRSNGATERNMNISREFKMLAMTNGIPVIDITAATMDDISDQDNPPMLSQVAWSKAIEYDADMAIAIHKYTNTNMIEVVSRKNRHGSEFDFYLDWDINRGVITPIYENLPNQQNDTQKN